MAQTVTCEVLTPKLVVRAPVDVMCHREARILSGLKDLHDEKGDRALVRLDDLIAHIAKRFGKSYSGLRPRLSGKFDEAIENLVRSKYVMRGVSKRLLFITEEGERLLSYLLVSRPELFKPTTSPNVKQTT